MGVRHYGFHWSERLGMRLEARLVESDLRPDDGAWVTELSYAILAREHRS